MAFAGSDASIRGAECAAGEGRLPQQGPRTAQLVEMRSRMAVCQDRNLVKSSGVARPPVYFVLHVPRTGGQTIEHHLVEHSPAGSVWLPDASPRSRGLWGKDDPNLPPDLNRVHVVAGHHVGRSLEQLFPGREIRRAVLLRDPLGVQVSLYNYRMMNHLNKGLGTYSFDLHCRALSRDWMSHWLLRGWAEISIPQLLLMSDAEKFGLLNDALAGFWFVGGHADCDRLIAALAAELDIQRRAEPRNTAREWRRQIYWEPVTLESLSTEQRVTLLARHRLDTALWQTWYRAGFEAAQVNPQPLGRGSRRPFIVDESVRLAALAMRWFRRECMPRLPLSAGRKGLRSGIIDADQARDANQWGLAAERYRRALIEEPRAPAIWVQYGHMLKNCGDLDGAEQAYLESAKLDPDNPDTKMQLANIQAHRAQLGREIDPPAM